MYRVLKVFAETNTLSEATLEMARILQAIFFSSFVSSVFADTTLFNDQEANLLPLDAPEACASTLGTALSCDPKLHLLYKQVEWAGWNATDLTTQVSTSAVHQWPYWLGS